MQISQLSHYHKKWNGYSSPEILMAPLFKMSLGFLAVIIIRRKIPAELIHATRLHRKKKSASIFSNLYVCDTNCEGKRQGQSMEMQTAASEGNKAARKLNVLKSREAYPSPFYTEVTNITGFVTAITWEY